MNKFRFSWAALSLVPPILVICAFCVGTSCSNGGSSPSLPPPTAALVQVEFISNVASTASTNLQNLQNLVLNVTAIRMFPSTTSTASPSETSGKWVVIPVPTATASSSTTPGDMPIDLIGAQSQLQLFNEVGVKSGKFSTFEVVLDATNPGYVVPLCTGGTPSPNFEGCTRFPLKLSDPTTPLQFQIPSTVPTTVQHQTLLLPISLNVSDIMVPGSTGKPYTITLTAGDGRSAATPYYAIVSGSVLNKKENKVSNSDNAKVTAVLSGTNTVIATADVHDSAYTLFLPTQPGVGTAYDLYVSGGTTTIVAQRDLTFTGGTSPSVGFTDVIGGQKTGGFAGVISDTCTGLPIQGATVQILEPGATATMTPDCVASPSLCVSVASGTTADDGSYPIKEGGLTVAPLAKLPIGSPTQTYVIQVSAPGYDTLIMEGTATQFSGGVSSIKGGKCFSPTTSPTASASPKPTTGTCSFSLNTSYIQGSINISTKHRTVVQVMSENSGTNTLVSTLNNPLVIPGGGATTGIFTLNVPTGGQSFDLFAVAEDQYQGAADPYPGHAIITAPNVTGPVNTCDTVNQPFSETLECVGHGSITGTVSDPDGGTGVQLSKDGVAITQVSAALSSPTATASASYSFCIPPDDTYKVQRLENGTPTNTPASVGSMATPMATSGATCPTTCFDSADGCPDICPNAKGGPSL